MEARVNPRWIKDIMHTIPKGVLSSIEHQKVTSWGFAAGPSFCAGYEERCINPIDYTTAMKRLSKYAGILKRAHLKFEGGTIIYFDPCSFRSVVN